MTEGTSQGLFVVVAIVIFGIFIGLTYTLFGSEGLSNDLKGIFINATEQASKSLDKYQDTFYRDNITAKIISNDKVEIYISGLETLPEDTKILFPTWTTYASGKPGQHEDATQDDLKANWGTNPDVVGENLGNGNWKYTVYRSEHFDEYGEYIVDIYKNGGGASNYLGGIRFNLVER